MATIDTFNRTGRYTVALRKLVNEIIGDVFNSHYHSEPADNVISAPNVALAWLMATREFSAVQTVHAEIDATRVPVTEKQVNALLEAVARHYAWLWLVRCESPDLAGEWQIAYDESQKQRMAQLRPLFERMSQEHSKETLSYLLGRSTE